MNKVLTISIAAYNVEKYIRETLNSLIVPEIIDKLEIFVVDDGGSDGTLEIAKEYAAKYPNSIFPIHKENGGYGSVYNYVIEKASGKYFKLLDGDDLFNSYVLKCFVEYLEKEDSDVVITDYKKFIDGAEIIYDHSFFANDIVKEECCFSDLVESDFFSQHQITFSTTLLKHIGFKLPEHKLYTDTIYSFFPFVNVRTISIYRNCILYLYRLDRSGQSMSLESVKKHYKDMIYIALETSKVFSKYKGKTKNDAWLMYYAARNCRLAIKWCALAGISKEKKKEIREFERNNRIMSTDVYRKITNMGTKKASLFFQLLRKTNYNLLILSDLFPTVFNKLLQ